MAKSSEVQVDIKLNTEEIIKELKSVQREAKKATQAVKEFSSTLDSNDDLVFSVLSAFSNDDLIKALELRGISVNSPTIDNILNQSIQSGVLVTDLNENIRGMGKTTALIKKASELNIPIIVGNTAMQRKIIDYANSIGEYVQCYSGRSPEQLRGKRFTNQSFLVDDTVSNKMIVELQKLGFKCIGGFNSLHTSIS